MATRSSSFTDKPERAGAGSGIAPGPKRGGLRRLARRAALGTLLIATAVVMIVGALSFADKIESFQPLGIETARQNNNLVVSAATASTELRVGDLILLVNGEQISSRSELAEELRRREVNDVVVLRGQRPLTVQHRLPPLDLDYPYLVLALIATVYLFIGLYTLLRGATRQVYLFQLWCLASAIVYLWTATYPLDDFGQFIYIVDGMARLLLPPLTLHFFLVFPRPLLRGWLSRTIIPFVYLPSAAIAIQQIDMSLMGSAWFGGNVEQKIVLLDRLELLLLVSFAAAAVVALTSHFLRAVEWQEGRQVLWIAIGMTAGYLPFILLYTLPRSFGLEAGELVRVAVAVPLALVPLSFAYAILRYRLWDITIIVRDVTTYTLTLLLGALGFLLLNLLVRRGIPEDFILARQFTAITGGLLIAGLLIPAKQGIGAALQRVHYRGSFGRRRALAHFAQELLHERDLEQLAAGLLRELEETMDLEQSNLFLLEGEHLEPIRIDLHAREDAVKLERIRSETWELDHQRLDGSALPEPELSAEHQLFLHGYRHAFPLTVRDRRIGLVVTGNKEGQVPLTSDDVLLIRQLLNQAALAIENAQLLEQMQRQLLEVMELKQFNEEIIESSPAGIVVFDQTNHVVSANLAFAALVGFERSSLKRQLLSTVLPSDMVPSPMDGIVEVSFVDHQGRERQLQLSCASFHGGNHERLTVLIVHDVTELAELERALEEKERMAALGMMAAGVAHEVNTPLTGISSYAQMLLADTPADDPRRELLEKVERQTFRAARIVNSLLDFARQSEPQAAPIDLDKVLAESADLLAERFVENKVELIWRNHDGAGPCVEGNEGELHQVFTNLILNAIEAIGETGGGEVMIGVEHGSDHVHVNIDDTGPGIQATDIGHIFQPFFSTKTGNGGTGLGLSISHEIIRRHGGDIRAANRAEGGCRFVVSLPRLRAPGSENGQDLADSATTH